MDPNEALKRCRKAIEQYRDGQAVVATMSVLVEHFEALDAWLVRGGFLPADWEKARSK
jgi:hypothetical protein